MKFAIKRVLPFLNNPKDQDPSYKMDLDFWDCFGSNNLCLITEEIGNCCLLASEPGFRYFNCYCKPVKFHIIYFRDFHVKELNLAQLFLILNVLSALEGTL